MLFTKFHVGIRIDNTMRIECLVEGFCEISLLRHLLLTCLTQSSSNILPALVLFAEPDAAEVVNESACIFIL